MKVKKESEKVGSNLNIQKTKIMASGPITSWEIDRETVEIVYSHRGIWERGSASFSGELQFRAACRRQQCLRAG